MLEKRNIVESGRTPAGTEKVAEDLDQVASKFQRSEGEQVKPMLTVNEEATDASKTSTG